MCDGDFKEAHERRIVLLDDDPTDVGVLVEYLYTQNFWANEDPDGNASKQDSALKLARLYLLADKYDLEGMKDITTKKIQQYTEIALPDQWLAVAESIYSATPDFDRRYPRLLCALVFNYMDSQQIEGKNGFDALEKWVEKGGRLTVDICRGYRMYWVRRVRNRNAELHNACEALKQASFHHDMDHEDCDDFTESWDPHRKLFDDSNLDVDALFDWDVTQRRRT